MPCGNPEPDLTPDREIDDNQPSFAERQVVNLTRLLCYACRQMEAGQTYMTADLSLWWRNHKAEDDRRLEREAQARREAEAANKRKEYMASVKARVLTQLSPEEREALGH